MKPQEIGMDKLNDNFGIENDNLGIENGIQETINTETTIVDMLENNGLEATAETAESIVENDTTKIDNNETTEQITNDSNPTTVDNKTEENKPKEPDSNFEEMYAKMFGTTIPKRDKVEEEEKAYAVKQEDFKTVENMSLFTNNSFYSRPVYKYIGIVFDSYIVIEYENEMYIVNQRAANERILYERVKKNYYNDSDKESQLMLLPDVINLTPRQMGIAQDNLQLFKKAGFDVEEFGDNTIKLNGVLNIRIELDTKKLFLAILDEINTVARTSRDEIEDKFISTVACKAAEKSKIALTAQEVDLLMQQLLSLPHPFMNPNGEPTAIRMSKIDIEKKFSRR